MRVQENANQMEAVVLERFKYLRKITEPCVWTDRMLTTLITGVKRGKWYSLMDKLISKENLAMSAGKVIANKGAPGIDNVTNEEYEMNIEHHNQTLLEELLSGNYTPRPVKRVYIPKAGTKEKRPLGIPAIRDRVVQRALLETIEVIFENEFSEHSYGFRPQRGCKDALREVNKLLIESNLFVVDADIRKYFDSISHERLLRLLEEKISDSKIIDLIRKFLKQGVMEELEYFESEQGTPQGGIISPLLANIYLDSLDKEMEARGHRIVRYADDSVILCRGAEEAQAALKHLESWMKKAELELNYEKTKIVDMTIERASFDFLGYTFMNIHQRIRRFPCKKSLRKYKDKIRMETRRCNGNSLNQLIEKLKPISRGWFEYYKHSMKNIFRELDSWSRMRLRSILRKRSGRKGRSHCVNDHKKWPNKFFEEIGFYSLEKAYNFHRQPISSNS